MSPWNLTAGIHFEDSGLLLPWGTTFEHLGALGEPRMHDTGTSLHLTWPARRVLGGLAVDASACRIRERPNPRAFHIYLAELHWISLALIEAHAEPADAHRHLRALHDHLAAELGPATFSYPDYSRGLPGIFWERAPLLISAGPKYGSTRLVITIKHTPDDYAELRAEAARISELEGNGARVENVAWNPQFV